MTAPAPTAPPPAAPEPPAPRARAARLTFWRSPEGQPAWARPALLALALVAGVLYGYGVRNGQLHNYYSAAVKSMSMSWKAFFYGAYDPAASITIDKLPGAFQVEALSARIFGYSTWSVLMPQVIESVLAILVLYMVVRRWLGPVSGIVAASTVDSAYTGSGIGPAAGPVQSMGGGGMRAGPGGPTGSGGPDGGTGGPGGGTGGPGTGTAPGTSTSATASTRTLNTIAWLQSHDPGSRYLLAVQGSQSGGAYIIAGASVLPIGGFTGSVPNVTATSLAELMSSGQLRYVLVGGGMGGGGMGGLTGQISASSVSTWVTGNCTAVSDSSLDLSGLYDCKAG